MTTPYLQPVSPQGAPGPVTPHDTPSNPSGFAGVTPHGQGPAPYDIQAPLADAEITAAFNEANATGGAGFLYPQGPRQAAAQALVQSPAGFGLNGFDIQQGFSGGGGGGWPNDVEPPADADNGGYGGA